MSSNDKPGAIGRLAARLDAWRAEQREIRGRAISFTIGRSNGVDDGRGLARKGIDPRLVSEETIQAVAADEAARQGLDAVAYAEGYGTGLVQIGETLGVQHPTGRGACDPEEAPCSGCAAAYAEPDPEEEIDQ